VPRDAAGPSPGDRVAARRGEGASVSSRLAVASGAALGALLALVVFAPAAWLAGSVASATGQRLLLADARGSVWQGSAVLVLTGGADSRDAAALPGRLHWRIGLAGMKLAVAARHECCLNGELQLLVEPGIGRVKLTLPPGDSANGGIRGQWPASWLAGLGTPWNTLQLGGWLRLASPGLTAEAVQGRWRLDGSAELQLDDVRSRLSTLPRLGSYRIGITGAGDGGAGISLQTIEGPLLLSGSGQWAASGVRFRGEARADTGAETVLNNLLNLIGRRQGALSVISIG
jgi:general secretion pathway protein N